MPNSNIKELKNIIDMIGDHLLSASDEEIIRESHQENVDPHSAANSLRDSMLQTVKTFRRRSLRSAQQAIAAAPRAPTLPSIGRDSAILGPLRTGWRILR